MAGYTEKYHEETKPIKCYQGLLQEFNKNSMNLKLDLAVGVGNQGMEDRQYDDLQDGLYKMEIAGQ